MKTSTQAIPEHHRIPRHIAVIMDGNGRWAKKRFMPRVMGHKKGLDALENLCAECSAAGVEYLTVFAFSTENWRRPSDEVGFLMGLFLQALQKQVKRMHEHNMRPSRICLSAPAARCASAISSFGRWRMPNCISRIPCGPISTHRLFRRPLPHSNNVNAVSAVLPNNCLRNSKGIKLC